MNNLLKFFLALSIFSLISCSNNPPLKENLAYVSTQNGGIVVINLNSFEVEDEFKEGLNAPRGLGITKDGKLLVAANRDDGDLIIIDRLTGKINKKILIGENPEFVRIKGDFAFVSYEPAALGGPPPKPGSEEALALEKQREEDDEEPAKIAVVDLIKGEVVKSITGGMETEGIEFSGDGKKILVTNEADENITVHDIETGEKIKEISTEDYGNRPRGIKISPDGKYYVGSIEYGNKLVLIDDQFNLMREVETGKVPYGVAFDKTGEKLLVALNKDKAIQVFNTKTWNSEKMIPTGDRCWHFTFTPDNTKILAACGRSDEVILIDALSLEPIKSIPLPNMPWGIVTFPKSIGSLDQPNI